MQSYQPKISVWTCKNQTASMLGETRQNSSDNKQWFSSNHIHKKRRLVPPFKSLGRGGFVLNFVVSRTSDLLLCVVANLRPHILKFARLRSTPLLHKIRRTTICGSHPIPFVKKRRLTPPFKSLGRGGLITSLAIDSTTHFALCGTCRKQNGYGFGSLVPNSLYKANALSGVLIPMTNFL